MGMNATIAFLRTYLSLRHPHRVPARQLYDAAVDHNICAAYVLGALADLIDSGRVTWTPDGGYLLTAKTLAEMDAEVSDALNQTNEGTSMINPNDPYTDPGITVRDYFAAMAMQGLLSNEAYGGTFGIMARDAATAADALIAELNKEPGAKP